MTGGN